MARGRRATIVSWWRVEKIWIIESPADEKSCIDREELGIRETPSLAHKLGRQHKLRHIEAPIAYRYGDEDWFLENGRVGDEGYILEHIRVVLEPGRKGIGYLLPGRIVYLRKPPRRIAREPQTLP